MYSSNHWCSFTRTTRPSFTEVEQCPKGRSSCLHRRKYTSSLVHCQVFILISTIIYMSRKYILYRKTVEQACHASSRRKAHGAASTVEWAGSLLRPLLVRKISLLQGGSIKCRTALFLNKIYFCSVEMAVEININTWQCTGDDVYFLRWRQEDLPFGQCSTSVKEGRVDIVNEHKWI